MMTRSILIALVLVMQGCNGVSTPNAIDDAGRLTLDRIHGGGEFSMRGAPRLRWLEGGGYTTLEGGAIIQHDPETGARETLVSAGDLTPAGRNRPLGISDYAWSRDGARLMIFTNTRRVWRRNTRGDYWVLDRDTKRLRRLGGDMESTWFQFAKFSPDGSRAAYLHEHDIYVEDLETDVITRLTDTASETITNGTFDWVYEEEWGLRDGFRWSPDGERIAFWQIDAEGTGVFTLVDYTSDLYPQFKTFNYPKVGTTNPICRVGVVEVDSGAITWMNIPGDERDDYVARMEWAESADELVLQRINRRQNENRILLADVRSGECREVYRDEDEGWVEVCDDLVWLEGGAKFTFLSERDGWAHAYVISRDGNDVRCVTDGDYDVTRILKIDEVGGYVYFIASPDDPTQRFLYRVPLAGGEAKRLTPDGMTGSHQYDISADARFAIHTSGAFGSPRRVSLITLPDHTVVREMVTNDDARTALDSLDRGDIEFFRVPIGDGVEVDGWAILPPNLDRSKKYPLIVYVYGEPAGQTVRDDWGGYYLWHLMLSQMGYVVVSLDNRGTPAPRGREWRKSVYGQIGILASQDQAAAVRSLLDEWTFLDRDRVGVWGWSGGGSMTLNALFRYPDLYHAGIAIAFVANQRYYDTIYQERYMGLPENNPDGFRDGSPITFAHQLEGDLLLMYGTGDDNCHYQNCETLINELVEHGKPFEMMAYPGRSHGIHEGPGTTRHLYETMLRFWTERLPAGPR